MLLHELIFKEDKHAANICQKRDRNGTKSPICPQMRIFWEISKMHFLPYYYNM